MADEQLTGILLLCALNSALFSALALRFLIVTKGMKGAMATLRAEWPSALIMGILGFTVLLVLLIVVLPSWATKLLLH